jgi:hypothetical protein
MSDGETAAAAFKMTVVGGAGPQIPRESTGPLFWEQLHRRIGKAATEMRRQPFI